MKILVILLLNLILNFNAFANNTKYNVGLLIMATGRYINFVPPLIDSAQKFFCTNHNVTYFVFTDSPDFKYSKTVTISQNKQGWPNDTMLRFETYFKNRDKFKNMDYLFSSDADMLFVSEVDNEIISDRVATIHPGFYNWKKFNQKIPYENNKNSTAYIDPKDGEYYFAGGFYGGTKKEVLKLFETNINNIYKDFKNDYVAVWHDESHINKYFLDNKPTKVLSPSYCFPEDAHKSELQRSYQEILHLPKKIIALSRKPAEINLEENQKTIDILKKYQNQVNSNYNSLQTVFNLFIKNNNKTIGYFDNSILNNDTTLFKKIASEILSDLNPKFFNLKIEKSINLLSKKIDFIYLNSSLLDDFYNAKTIIDKNLLSSKGIILINSKKSENALSLLLNNGFEIIENKNQVILKKRG